MALSRTQRIWLAILPKISSVFSLFGSMWIIIEVATVRSKRRAPYHRLLLAMSIYDVLESVWNFGSTWPIPKGSPDIIWAYGNTATCTAQGFFLTLSSAVPLYNAMLSFYYVLVINHNYSDAKLRKFVEPAMHLFCFVWAFGTALYSSLAGLINNANLWCWIAPLPTDCKDSWTHGTAAQGNPNPCIRGDNVWVYRFGFYFIPLWMSIFLATFATYLVYRYVYARDKATLRYRFPDRASIFGALKSLSDDMKQKLTEISSSMGFRKSTTEVSVPIGDLDDFSSSSIDASDDEKIIHDDDDEIDSQKNNNSSSKHTASDEFSASEEPTDGFDEHAKMEVIDVGGPLSIVEEVTEEFEKSGRSDDQTAFRSINIDDNTPNHLKDVLKEDVRNPGGAWAVSMKKAIDMAGNSSMDDSIEETSLQQTEELQHENTRRGRMKRKLSRQVSKHVSERVDKWKAKRERFAREMPHTIEVFHQACFYLGAFYCTHIWSTSNRIVQQITGGGSVFPLLAIHAFFDPFQGFLNYLVYQRPRYMQLRKRHPEFSRVTILLFILRFSFMGGNNARNLRQMDPSQDKDFFPLQSKRSKMGLSSDFVKGVEDSKTSLEGSAFVVPTGNKLSTTQSSEPTLNAGL